MAKDTSHADVTLAAGGVVWRDSAHGRQVAIVHRPKYDDWTLPKGKLSGDETWQECAVREVKEETGLDVKIGDFAGGCAYLTKKAPKVALFWHMETDGATRFAGEHLDEVDALEWLDAEDAAKRLTYERERRVLRESLGSGSRDREARNGEGS